MEIRFAVHFGKHDSPDTDTTTRDVSASKHGKMKGLAWDRGKKGNLQSCVPQCTREMQPRNITA